MLRKSAQISFFFFLCPSWPEDPAENHLLPYTLNEVHLTDSAYPRQVHSGSLYLPYKQMQISSSLDCWRPVHLCYSVSLFAFVCLLAETLKKESRKWNWHWSSCEFDAFLLSRWGRTQGRVTNSREGREDSSFSVERIALIFSHLIIFIFHPVMSCILGRHRE